MVLFVRSGFVAGDAGALSEGVQVLGQCSESTPSALIRWLRYTWMPVVFSVSENFRRAGLVKLDLSG